MPLAPGSKIGIYDIVEMIGVGGMGEVYRATDSRLDRSAAIKTLPEEFAADRDRLARFEREARVLAQLNHPHIASIYGIEPGPPVALAMEMADGETLAHRIQQGPLELDDALVIARQIAEGLEHAHAKGIVHRDLKPANIKIGERDGKPHVKILDFGLAKAMSADASASAVSAVSSPTITSPANLTRAGLVLGTAAYMAPEQARGRHVDHRADIWAFGCVLFEMLAGRRPFEGDDVADVMAKVIQSDPEWTALPSDTPASLRTLLVRCLRKDPHRRLHAIADARIELDELPSRGGVIDAVETNAVPARRGWLPAAAGLAAGALIGVAAMGSFRPASSPAVPGSVVRFHLAPPEGLVMHRAPNTGRYAFALSPDGQKLAVLLTDRNSRRAIFIRQLSGSSFRELEGTEGASQLFWARDSMRLGFLAPGGIRVIDTQTGGSRTVANIPNFLTAAWSGRDILVTSASGGAPLMQVPATGGQPMPIGQRPAGVAARVLPRWLPDDERFIFADSMGDGNWMLRAMNLAGDSVDIMPFQSGGNASAQIEYQSGHLLLAAADPTGRTQLTAQPFDASGLRLTGAPIVLATDLNPAFTASRTMLAMAANRSALTRFAWVDTGGTELATLGDGLEQAINFDVSPDERYLAAQATSTLLLHDLARGVTTAMGVRGTDPIWSPDGKEIAYTVPLEGGGIFAVAPFGGTPRKVFAGDGATYVEDWSRDGRWLAAVSITQGLLIPTAGGAPVAVTGTLDGSAVDELQFSPDARWLAYGARRGVDAEVFLTSVPPNGQRWQLSVGGGVQPRWTEDGKAVYYLNPAGALMKVDVTFLPNDPPRLSAPRELLKSGMDPQFSLDQYYPSRDGKRFLMRRSVETSTGKPDQIEVIVNWPSLLKSSQ